LQSADRTVLLCAHMNADVTFAFAEHTDLAVNMLLAHYICACAGLGDGGIIYSVHSCLDILTCFDRTVKY
jgi:hypothetical protein